MLLRDREKPSRNGRQRVLVDLPEGNLLVLDDVPPGWSNAKVMEHAQEVLDLQAAARQQEAEQERQRIADQIAELQARLDALSQGEQS